MNTDVQRWCGQFKRCNGCKLQSECMVKPEDGPPYIKNGVVVDPWANRTTEMIKRELAAK
ncbi:antirestriction Ral family protein [Erwinia sp. P7711]|uniref:antirestriction Ral family protein n=1 Tax=Erwinia sp. P7711 TaxID=3141451 RepID=UPI00318EE255